MSLNRLLNPKSIAVVGGRSAEEVFRQIAKLDFAGPVYAVNPKREQMVGHDCFDSLSDLPEVPDAVFIGAPADPTIELVAQARTLGCAGAVCLASGFREIGGDGVARQERLIAAADGMPLIGPNCYGVINYMNGAALWPDQHGGGRVDGGVAIITQSGNMAVNFTMQQRGMPLAMLICLGNQANTGIQDCVDAMLDDARIHAIGLHIEGLTDIAAFSEIARKALLAKKPIVALKTGKSEAGAQIAQSHTASLVGADNLFDALFDRLGVARVDDVDEFLETLKFLSVAGPVQGNKIASMSCSGGEASLFADLVEGSSLEFPPIEVAQHRKLFDALGERVSISNPLDYHTYIWGQEDSMCHAFSAMMSGDYDVSFLVYDFPREDRCVLDDWWAGARGFARAAAKSNGIAAILATMGETIDESIAQKLIADGIVPMLGMKQAIVAVEAAHKIGRAQTGLPQLPLIDATSRDGVARNVDEWRATGLLKQSGLSVPEMALVSSVGDAVEKADIIGYPLVMKIVSTEIVHKTDAGGVVLNLKDAASVRKAAEGLLQISDELMIAKMIDGAVAEMIIGVSRDPLFGPYLMIGLGGVTVELIRDRRVLLLPAYADDIRAAILDLKLSPLLTGYRGRPHADVEAIVHAVASVAEFVDAYRDQVVDVEINPLLVRDQGQGAFVADAFMNIIGNLPGDSDE
ncbi:MAG: acetate--CoA ligase family protein [Pseudomonadota bacterium]